MIKNEKSTSKKFLTLEEAIEQVKRDYSSRPIYKSKEYNRIFSLARRNGLFLKDILEGVFGKVKRKKIAEVVTFEDALKYVGSILKERPKAESKEGKRLCRFLTARGISTSKVYKTLFGEPPKNIKIKVNNLEELIQYIRERFKTKPGAYSKEYSQINNISRRKGFCTTSELMELCFPGQVAPITKKVVKGTGVKYGIETIEQLEVFVKTHFLLRPRYADSKFNTIRSKCDKFGIDVKDFLDKLYPESKAKPFKKINTFEEAVITLKQEFPKGKPSLKECEAFRTRLKVGILFGDVAKEAFGKKKFKWLEVEDLKKACLELSLFERPKSDSIAYEKIRRLCARSQYNVGEVFDIVYGKRK